MPRAQSHLRRTGRTRGFTLHYRHLGVSLGKMDRWIQHHYRTISSIIVRATGGRAFNAQMGAAAIARGDYRPDRALDLSGVAAYDREKQKCMKDLGLVSKHNRITERMRNYIAAVRSSGRAIPLLREYGLRIKLQGPQISWRTFHSGYRQAGYSHYRIRPLVMFLYSIRSGVRKGVKVNTDDIALSAFRLFTPQQVPRVDEAFLMRHIDDYFVQKANTGINYKREFERQFQKVQQELGVNLTHRHAFEQKCRNAANEIYCTSLFLHRTGLIGFQRQTPSHWSSTQMSYEKTGPVVFGSFALTPKGEIELKKGLRRIPVWGRDITHTFPAPGTWSRVVDMVNQLAQGNTVAKRRVSPRILKGISLLGLEVVEKDGAYSVRKPPEFELQYDLE